MRRRRARTSRAQTRSGSRSRSIPTGHGRSSGSWATSASGTCTIHRRRTFTSSRGIRPVAISRCWRARPVPPHSWSARFAGLALALAATGVSGIAAYAVSRRTQEIGIRVTLGAGRAAVLRLIVGHGLALTLTGIALGVAGALATTQVLRAYLFEVGSRDPVVLLAVGSVVVATTLVASYVPARRATKIDPMVALRSE